MKPQRTQGRTLCPQKDLFIKEINERQGAWRKSAKDEVALEWEAERKGTG
jgi:hypothetical protein